MSMDKRTSREPLMPARAGIEKLIDDLVAALPVFDHKLFQEAVAETRERPRASCQVLFKLFSSDDPARRALARRILAVLGGADIQDDLNALIFDADLAAWPKVMANDLLAEMGAPVDPDVFAMSVPDAAEQQKRLPSRALALLAESKTAEAVAHARSLPPAERWVLIQDAAERRKEDALEFLRTLAADDESNAAAVVSAVVAALPQAGLPLLIELQSAAGKDLQKQIKRMLFDLRESGVAVPEEKPAAPAPTPAAERQAETETDMPVYKSLMSDVTEPGLALVAIARRRPDGRLKVFTVLVDLWKRGIGQTAFRNDISKSSFDRFLQSQGAGRMRLKDASVADCRRLVARGVRVAREFGTPLPFDFGSGRALLGDLDPDIAALKDLFLCSKCGQPLDAETIDRIRINAPYENMRVETRCAECRK